MEKFLKGKVLLVTGGSSRLGQSLVQQAVHAGADVHFTYCKSTAAAEKLEKLGATAHVLDLSKPEMISRFAKQFCQAHKKLNLLIHNAAAVRDRTLSNLTEEDWDYVLSVNLKAPFVLTQAFLPILNCENENRFSKVFFLTSRTAVLGAFGVANYAAAKAGLIGLTKTLAIDLAPNRILVNAINPGFMQSAMTQAMPEMAIKKNIEANPLRGYSDPEQVADFILALCSDKMTQVTGQVFHYEGRIVY